MIKLPCGARFMIQDEIELNSDITPDQSVQAMITVTDRVHHFSNIIDDTWNDDIPIAQKLEVFIRYESLWPIIRELEKFAKEHDIKEIK